MTRKKNTVIMTMAALIIAAIAILAPLRAITATATVYTDDKYTATISDTIDNEAFPSMVSNIYSGIAINLSANNAGGYTTLLKYPLVCEIDVDNYNYMFTYQYNTNTSSLMCYVHVSDEEQYIIQDVWSAPLSSSANYMGFIVYGTATSLSYVVILNNRLYSGGATGLNQNIYATRYLSIWNFVDGPLDISTFSTGDYHIGYGCISYQTCSQIKRSVDNGTYYDGYSAGLAAGEDGWDNFNGWTWLRSALSCVGDILSIEIGPNIYLGYFVALPLILGAVMFVLQFKR